jgi:hypothetical protein
MKLFLTDDGELGAAGDLIDTDDDVFGGKLDGAKLVRKGAAVEAVVIERNGVPTAFHPDLAHALADAVRPRSKR